MFLLSKRLGEKILIGNDITVTVVETNGNRVRLRIDAPDQVRIARSDLGGQAVRGPAPGASQPQTQL
jgi:carbon storage regulator